MRKKNIVANKTLKLIGELTNKEKSLVDSIIKRHVQACKKSGVAVENLERVVIEAIEKVRLDGSDAKVEITNYEPVRNYANPEGPYSSPRLGNRSF